MYLYILNIQCWLMLLFGYNWITMKCELCRYFTKRLWWNWYTIQQIIIMLELKLGLLGFMAWHIVCSLLLRLYFVRDCIIVADFTKHATVYVTVYTGHLYLADDKVKWINMREAMGRNIAGTRGKSLSPLLTVFHTCAQIFPERGGVKDMG